MLPRLPNTDSLIFKLLMPASAKQVHKVLLFKGKVFKLSSLKKASNQLARREGGNFK
jgi:hypothetical protein